MVVKRRPINFEIDLAIYPFRVMVSLNETTEKFTESIKQGWDTDILEDLASYEHPCQAGLAYLYLSDNKSFGAIRLHSFEKTPEGYSDLQHEIFHIAEFVLRKCGVILNENSHESYAYLIGYLTKEIYKRIWNTQK